MSIDIEKIFNNAKIDYINLEEVNVFFRFKILKSGKLLYTTNEDKLFDYVHKVQSQYIEMSYSRKKYMDKDRINEKILYLNELVFELDQMSKIDKKEFLKNKLYVEATENYLRKALQVVIDLADDMVTKNRLRSM